VLDRIDLEVPSADPPRRLVTAEDALALTIADFAATAHRDDAPALRQELNGAIAASRVRGTYRPPVSPVSGAELMRELGVSEGPNVGRAKAAIEEAIDAGEIAADDYEAALAVARAAILG